MTYADVVRNSTRAPPLSKTVPKAPPCPLPLNPVVETKPSIKREPARNIMTGVKYRFAELKLDSEIQSYSDTYYHPKMKTAEADFREFVTQKLPPKTDVWLVGSFAAGLDILDSDLDFTIKIDDPEYDDKLDAASKLDRVEMKLDWNKFSGEVIRARVPVLQLVHKPTNVKIDVIMDNGGLRRNAQLLVWYRQFNDKFSVLCKAIKAWASKSGVLNSREGRLNSISICFILIQFLQSWNELPNIQQLFPEINGEFEIKDHTYQGRNLRNELDAMGLDWKKTKIGFRKHKKVAGEYSLSDLMIGFFNYFAEFDFNNYWISIKSGRKQRKTFNKEGEPINGYPPPYHCMVVEDPFLPNWNCAGTVKHYYVYRERIQEECRQAVNDILRTNALFSKYPSPLNRKNVLDGKAIDLRIVRKRNFLRHPSVYWEENKIQYDNYKPWPKRSEMIYYWV